MPLPVAEPSLADLADTITAAHAAAVHANDLANGLIRISLKKRMLAGETLTAARKLLGDQSCVEWLVGLGITLRDARRYLNFPAQAKIEGRSYTRYGNHAGGQSASDTLPTTLTTARRTIEKMHAEVDTVPLDELARIERVAAAMKYLFWDAADCRDAALDVSLRAGARLRQPTERLSTTPFRHYREAAD